jgi:hypothetical protein
MWYDNGPGFWSMPLPPSRSDVQFSPMSAKTGWAPTAKRAVRHWKTKVGMITSSFRTPHARKAISIAKLPDPQRTASSTPSLSITAVRRLPRSSPSMAFEKMHEGFLDKWPFQ